MNDIQRQQIRDLRNAGYSYKDILSHYYPGTTLTK